MKNNKENEEIQSRREFFKEAAKKTLPVIAMVTVGSLSLASCEKEDTNSYYSSDGCGGSCKSLCENTCTLVCASGCRGTCRTSSGSY